MKPHGRAEAPVTGELKSYSSTPKQIGAEDRQVTGRWERNQVENSHQPLR